MTIWKMKRLLEHLQKAYHVVHVQVDCRGSFTQEELVVLSDVRDNARDLAALIDGITPKEAS